MTYLRFALRPDKRLCWNILLISDCGLPLFFHHIGPYFLGLQSLAWWPFTSSDSNSTWRFFQLLYGLFATWKYFAKATSIAVIRTKYCSRVTASPPIRDQMSFFPRPSWDQLSLVFFLVGVFPAKLFWLRNRQAIVVVDLLTLEIRIAPEHALIIKEINTHT